MKSENQTHLSALRLFALTFGASFCCCVIVYFFLARYFPESKILEIDGVTKINSSDAVAIANTYIAYTAFVVTAFAILITVFTFYFNQNTTEMKMRKFEDELLEHLKTGDHYSQKLLKITDEHVDEYFSKFSSSKKFDLLVEKLLDAGINKLKENAGLNSGVKSIIENARAASSSDTQEKNDEKY